nr:HeH/LEM domain-containing protein [uncultured Acinetobacter sp.]
MKTKVKKIYFTDDFSQENVSKLQDDGWTLRKASAAKPDDFIEQADEYGGDVPEWYKGKSDKITVQVAAEISPELQASIDEEKAECEKVQAENESLKQQIEALGEVQGNNSELLSENSRLQDALLNIIGERDALVVKAKELDDQLAGIKGELIGFQNNIPAMKARIEELESVDYSKMKVDEVREVLKLKNIDFPSDAKKEELLALIPKE